MKSFADEVARQAPFLPRNTARIDHVDGPLKDTIGSLGHAGILPGHPSYRWAQPQSEPTFFLLPPGRERRIDAGEEAADILLAGSSFSQGFFARALLADALQAPVADGSVQGRPPLYSLGTALLRREPAKLPKFVVAEFPIYPAV